MRQGYGIVYTYVKPHWINESQKETAGLLERFCILHLVVSVNKSRLCFVWLLIFCFGSVTITHKSLFDISLSLFLSLSIQSIQSARQWLNISLLLLLSSIFCSQFWYASIHDRGCCMLHESSFIVCYWWKWPVGLSALHLPVNMSNPV